MTPRIRIAALSAMTVLAVAGVVHAQFAAPTCVPPNCSPEVIQNILTTNTAQDASINVTGSGKLGGKFETGAQLPTFTTATDYLYFGNINGASSAGYLLTLQTGGADRMKVSINGQQQLPLGSAAAPSYSFLGDTNTGFYSSSADTIVFVTNGAARTTTNNSGFTLNSGAMSSPTGSAAAPAYTFTGDSNTGMYSSAADTLNLATAGVSRLQIDSTGLVTIPGSLTVQGTFTATGGLGGDGSAITNINASNITSGTLADARLSSNVALLDRANQNFTGNNNFAGMVTVGSASLPVIGAQNLIYGNVDTTSTGALLLLQNESVDRFRVAANGDVTATSFSGVGTNLTSLNASNLASGTVPSARLSGTYSNALTFSNRTSFGSASLNVAAGNSLIYGNVDTASAGYLLRLQNESADAFTVDVYGNVTTNGSITAGPIVASSISVGGQPVLTGSGTSNYVPKWSSGSALGNSVIYDDGSSVGIGTTSLGSKLTVNGSMSASTVSTYIVAAGTAGVTGQVVGVGSYGVVGSGGSYGVYGVSSGDGIYGYNSSAGGTGAGVHGYGTGTSPGVQGESQSGWGGSFSSLYVTPGTSYFASGVTLNGGATLGANSLLTLGSAASDPVGANGAMYYNTGSNAFRCYASGAWGGCGVGGSGTTNYVARFTGTSTLGTGAIQDNGSTVSIGGTPAGTALTVVGPTSLSNALIATTNANNGVGIYGFGLGTTSIGLYGQGQGAGVYGNGSSASGVGLQGTGGYAGVTGTTTNNWGYGVLGTTSANSYVYGVYGITASSQYTAAGVAGINSGNGMGGYFQSNNATTYALLAYNGGNPTTGYAFQAQGASNFTGAVTMNSTLAVTSNITIGGVSVCRQNGTNCPALTEADTLATVTGRGATTTTALTLGPTSGTALTATGTGAGGYFTAQSNGSVGVQAAMTASGSYGVYATNSGASGHGVYGSGNGGSGIGVEGNGTLYGVAGTGAYGVYGNGTSYGLYGYSSSGYGSYAYSSNSYGNYAYSANNYGTYSRGYDTGGYFTNAWGAYVHVARYGGALYAAGYDSGGHFIDLDGTSEAYASNGGYGLMGYGTTMGGYFANSNGYSYAYLAYGSSYGLYIPYNSYTTYGVVAYGQSTGGRFYDSGGTATTFIAGASYGVQIVTGDAIKPSGSSWQVSSDARVKKDVSDFKDGLAVTRQLNPVNFTYNGLGDTVDGLKGIGFIAQDVKDIVPYMMHTRMAKLHPDDLEDTEIYTIEDSSLSYINLNAIKDLDLRIDGLEAKFEKIDEIDARVKALEGQVEALQEKVRDLEAR